jgi:hypothetical protein
MGKVIVVIILYVFLSALLRLESKLLVAVCRDAIVIRGIFDTNSENSGQHRSSQTTLQRDIINFQTNIKENFGHIYKMLVFIL